MLAASGAALAQKKASKPKMSVGGYFEAILGAVDNDDASPARVAVDVQQDSEIHFKGSVALDNGIKIRTRVEIEAQSGSSSDIIDEAYMAVSGSFGEIRAGSEDSAPHLMVTPYSGHWGANVASNAAFDTGDWIDKPAGHTLSSVNRLDLGDADSEKITYFTPRIEGLQVGVSYLPGLGGAHEGINDRVETRTGSFEGYSIAANLNRKLGGVGLGLAVGYITANRAGQTSDPGGWGGGIRLKFGGATVAYGYHNEWNLSSDTASTNSGNQAHDFGIKYKAGKNNFSLGYAHIESEGDRAIEAEDEIDHAMASYRRDLGPGVQYRLNFMWADFEGEAAGSADDNEGLAVTTSIRVSF
jgi:hypothetical protein